MFLSFERNNMDLIQECDVDSSKFQEILETIKEPFKQSEVYNTRTEEKTIDTDLRSSEFRVLTNPKIFDLAEEVISTINETQPKGGKKFCLYKNDIMHIRYVPGGYFKEHEDYLSITSNFVEEYSLIVCVRGKAIRGRTILKLNQNFSVKSEASCTTNRALLFRKDIIHAGEELAEGDIKEIITFNVWAFEHKARRIVKISFQKNFQDERFILLNADKIKNYPGKTLLQQFLRSKIGRDKKTSIVDYDSRHSYESLKIIEKLYNGQAISFNEFNNYSEMLDFHLFDCQKLLIKSIENAIVPTSKINKDPMIYTRDFILIGNELDYLNFLVSIQGTYDREKMVPFKIILAEGMLSYGGGLSDNEPTPITMRPVFVSFYEENCVMFMSNIMGKSVQLPTNFYRSTDYDFVDDQLYEDQKDTYEELPSGSEFYLEMTEDGDLGNANFNGLPLFFVNLDDYSNGWEGTSIHYLLEVSAANTNYPELVKYITSRDAYLRKFVKPKDIDPELNEKVSNKIQEIQLYEKIIAQMNYLAIPNTQRTNQTESEFYCNENVYGNFNLIMLHGFLFL